MRSQLAVLAHLAASVSGLTIAQGGSKLVHARDPAPSRVPSSDCTDSPGWTYSPSDWQKFRQGTDSTESIHRICLDKDPGNGRGTFIHVDEGCVVINDSKRCETPDVPGLPGNNYHVAANQGQTTSFATIYAMFKGDDTDPEVHPGCRLEVTWPSEWRVLVFKDNCLSDVTGEWKECCTADDLTETFDNPYL